MKMSWSRAKSALALGLITVGLAAGAVAQQQPGAGGGTVVTSEPGKAEVVTAVKISAQVVGIDKATRTVTLKGPKGRVVDIVAGDEVKNFDQIQLGDHVVARYLESVSLALTKDKPSGADVVTTEETARAQPGERPAVAGAREVTALAEVTAVNPKKSTITLKGPRGNSVTLNVHNPDQFKVVKKGDHVRVTYTEALALSVEPAPKPAAKKK
jgi:hypothetical protein